MNVIAQKVNGDNPAHYRICAQGVFELRWLHLLSGVWVISEHGRGEPHVTTFVGCVTDQAALLGALEQIYCLGMPILLVEWLADEHIYDSI